MSNPSDKNIYDDPFKEFHPNDNVYVPPTILAVDDTSNPINSQPPTTYGVAMADPMSYSAPELSKDSKGLATPLSPAPGAAVAAAPVPDAAQSSQEIKKTSKFWTLKFYQQFFDINTQQVLIRISNTIVPINPPDFLMDRNWHYSTGNVGGVNAPTNAVDQGDLIVDGIRLSRNPDLYGPFWICTTLWMILGVVSNIMSRIAYTRDHSANQKSTWTYDFSVATVACVVMYLYCFVFGSIVWGIMQWKSLPVTLTDTLCLYGYSMFIFILAALLCMIPVSLFQWLVVILCGLWSTVFLISNFWYMWKRALDSNSFLIIVGLVSIFHMGLSLSFKFYFMNYSY